MIREEEEAFLRTLDKGLKKIDETMAQSKASKIINGVSAFELLDTYGFPIDLTRLIAAENNLTVDEAGFETEMQQQKNRSRSAAVLDTEDWVVLIDNAANKFVGYDALETKSKLLRYRKVSSKTKELFQLVLDTTPFLYW